jgi:hypothetical protein
LVGENTRDDCGVHVDDTGCRPGSRVDDDSIRRHLYRRVAYCRGLRGPDGAHYGAAFQYGGNPENNIRCSPPPGPPGPLTIANGVARYSGRGNWPEGSVNAQGVLVIHVPYGNRLDAQIDGRGTVTGRITGAWICSYHMVWQKEGK